MNTPSSSQIHAKSASRTHFQHGSAKSEISLCTPTQPETQCSHILLDGKKIVLIAHHDQVYKLQATKLGKLILTK